MALFQLHQSIKMKRCWSLINLRIAVTLSFSEKIFLHVNGTYRPMFSLCLLLTSSVALLPFLIFQFLFFLFFWTQRCWGFQVICYISDFFSDKICKEHHSMTNLLEMFVLMLQLVFETSSMKGRLFNLSNLQRNSSGLIVQVR